MKSGHSFYLSTENVVRIKTLAYKLSAIGGQRVTASELIDILINEGFADLEKRATEAAGIHVMEVAAAKAAKAAKAASNVESK